MKQLNFIPKEIPEKGFDSIDIREEDIDTEILNAISICDDHFCIPKNMIGIRNDGEFKHLAIWLNRNYDYKLGKDNLGSTILIPLKKK